MALNFLNNGYFAGSVGIGTESPGKQFTVRSLNNSTNAFAGFYALNESQGLEIGYAGIYSGGTNADVDMNIQAKGTGNILMTGSGNVGIGTASPGYKLDVSGTGQITSRIISTDNSGARFDLHSSGGGRYSQQALANGDFFMYDETSGHPIQRYFDGASGAWAWYTVGTERMRISAAGAIKFNAYGAGT